MFRYFHQPGQLDRVPGQSEFIALSGNGNKIYQFVCGLVGCCVKPNRQTERWSKTEPTE